MYLDPSTREEIIDPFGSVGERNISGDRYE